MKKLEDLFDDNFKSRCVAMIALLIVSVGLQYLMFKLGSVSPAHNADFDSGIWIDSFLFAVITSLTWLFANPPFLFSNGRKTSGRICVFIIWLAIIGLYIRVIIANTRWEMTALCVVALAICWIMLEKMGAEIGILGIFIVIPLIYIIGTYLAILLNGHQVTVHGTEISVVLLTTLAIWLRRVDTDI